MDDAIRLLKTREMKGLPYEPEPAANENKFVYASAEIALESARRDRFYDALLAEKAAFNLARYSAFTATLAASPNSPAP
jgi:hypothetical protein